MNPFRLHVENCRAAPEMFHVTEAVFADAAGRHAELARALDVRIGWDGDIFESSMKECDGLLGYGFPITGVAPAPRLRWVQLTGAGVDHLQRLFDWLPDDVVVTNNSGVHAGRGGEYGAMAILALNARLPAYATQKERREWRPYFVPGVAGKTVLIVGVGALGESVAVRCKALGMTVLGIRRSREAHPAVDEMHGPGMLHALLPRADFVVLTTPLTAETRGMIGPRELGLMKREAGLLNLARAGVLDHTALRASLESGHLSGAILDVFDPEPLPPGDALWSLPNTIFTPHVSCDDPGQYIPATLDIFFANLRQLLNGQPMRNVVDLGRGY